MGGHGALICFLKNPGLYKSVSAFAPICNPVECAWGHKAFGGYLGDNREAWKEYDACELIKKYDGPAFEILADQVIYQLPVSTTLILCCKYLLVSLPQVVIYPIYLAKLKELCNGTAPSKSRPSFKLIVFPALLATVAMLL